MEARYWGMRLHAKPSIPQFLWVCWVVWLVLPAASWFVTEGGGVGLFFVNCIVDASIL